MKEGRREGGREGRGRVGGRGIKLGRELGGLMVEHAHSRQLASV